MTIKELLQQTADKYKVSITFQDKCRKANLRSEIEESLIINGYKDFKTVSSFNPEKITILWQEAQ